MTPTSPWPHRLPWPWHALGQVSPPGSKDPDALLLGALTSPGLRALEAGTAVELLDVFSGLEARGEELAEAIAAGNPGVPLPGRAAELREALEQGPRGLALRLWPKLQVVVTLDAGGQAEAVAALGALWCQGLDFFSPAYAASGGQQDSRGVSWGQGAGSHCQLPCREPYVVISCNPPQHQQLHFTNDETEVHRSCTDSHTAPVCQLQNHCRFPVRTLEAWAEPGEVTKEGVEGQQWDQMLRGLWPGVQGEGLAENNGTTR